MQKTNLLPLIFFSLVALLLQEFVLNNITIVHITPNIITIWLAFLAVNAGQKTSTSCGFVLGLFSGVMGDVMGLTMLAFTVRGFIAGYFYTPEESHATPTQVKRRYYLAIVLASLCGNAVMMIGNNPLGLSAAYRFGVLNPLETLFTLLLGILVHWFFLKKIFAD